MIRLVGQERVKTEIDRIVESGRVSHAYLLSGAPGIGKKALALYFAERLNRVAESGKRGWMVHPDIHLFMPMPKNSGMEELAARVAWLADDPYAIVDFGLRPATASVATDDASSDAEGDEPDAGPKSGSKSGSRNRNAFYSADYFREDIAPKFHLTPYQGPRSIFILTGVETMRKEAANSFLKVLEEPPPNVVFILVTDRFNGLLPTIVSRCQVLHVPPLPKETVRQALMDLDGFQPEDADYLTSATFGNYAQARFMDRTLLKGIRSELVEFLRGAYRLDPATLHPVIAGWDKSLSRESAILLLNMMEVFLLDLVTYRATGSVDRLTNRDQADVIRKFTGSLTDARLERMIEELEAGRRMIRQNVNVKYYLYALAFRFAAWMRGHDAAIADAEPWHHLPAVNP